MGSGVRRAFLVATGMVLLAGGASAPASADPESERGPSVGFVEGSPGTVAPGWTGPLVVAGFSTTDDFTYRLRVTGPGGYDVGRSFELDEGESMRREVALPPLEVTGRYRARLADENGTVDAVRFQVAADVTTTLLRVESAPPAVFLPRVRDGIDDTARMRYAVSRPATVRGTVLDADGRVLRRVDLGRRAPGATRSWSWDGTAGGRTVERGAYRMRLDATSGEETATSVHDVRVASYRVGVDRRVARSGMATSSRSPGGCRLAATEDRGLDVDCRGARTGAALRYWFATGGGAARWKVVGEGTASRSAQPLGRGTAVVLRVPAGARWRTDEVAAGWRTHVLR